MPLRNLPLFEPVECEFGSGPIRIALVGDFPSAADERAGALLTGTPGYVLNKRLERVGIDLDNCLVTSVFQYHPPKDDPQGFFIKRSEWNKLKKEGSVAVSPYPAFGKLGYLHPKLEAEIVRLEDELLRARANVVVCLGPLALWALTGLDKLTVHRGSTALVRGGRLAGTKYIATYHPGALLQQWEVLPTFEADLSKAERESHSPLITRRPRTIWIDPTLEDLYEFERTYLSTASIICSDIETERRQITCIGFSPNPDIALCVPLWDKRQPGWSYWSREDEIRVWQWLRRVLGSEIPKLFHNANYDVPYLAAYGVMCKGIIEDSMIKSHALNPEGLKSLGYLGSIRTSESSWKALANFKQSTDKAGDSE